MTDERIDSDLYDQICRDAKEKTKAAIGVIMIVLDGCEGTGLSMYLNEEMKVIPPSKLLRDLADDLEEIGS